jgi:hypothetical protein
MRKGGAVIPQVGEIGECLGKAEVGTERFGVARAGSRRSGLQKAQLPRLVDSI